MVNEAMVLRAVVRLDGKNVWPVTTSMELVSRYGEHGLSGIGLATFRWVVNKPLYRDQPLEHSALCLPVYLHGSSPEGTQINLRELLDRWRSTRPEEWMEESMAVVVTSGTHANKLSVRSIAGGHMLRMYAKCEARLEDAVREAASHSVDERFYTTLFDRLQSFSWAQAKPWQQLGAF